MSHVSIPPPQTKPNFASRLRKDLSSVVAEGPRRSYRIIIDEISGRYARVSDHVWQRLCRGTSDDGLWQQARAAGWTRERTPLSKRHFSPLYFRIGLGSIDAVASVLAAYSGLLFSRVAVVFWALMISVAALIAVGQSNQWSASIGSLQQFFEQANPLTLAIWFVVTKIAHELGHAVMCRRMGSRCGSVGVLFLCGMPCPYCDVTDIWRQPSARRRAAVMLAGIYVELILASIATFVWILAHDPAIRLHSLNLMMVCGVSTLVFNANPLMRYDGYYVLSDAIGSANLRFEASSAFRSVITRRIAGNQYLAAVRSDLRSVMLAAYHTSSTLYRFAVSFAIAMMMLAVAEYLQIRSAAVGLIFFTSLVVVLRLVRRLGLIVRGTARWEFVTFPRRILIGLFLLALLLGILFVPLPRYRKVIGQVDTATATKVFLPSDGMIEDVGFEYGDSISTGQTLLRIRDESLAIEQAKLKGHLRMASLRSSLARRVTLDRNETADQWQTLQAVEDALAARLASVSGRVNETKVKAASSGIVLPPQPTVCPESDGGLPLLGRRIGTSAKATEPWCRISGDGHLNAVLLIDARDRSEIELDSQVRVSLVRSPETVFSSTVAEVSAIANDDSSVMRLAAYQVICPLPAVPQSEMLPWIGTQCQAVFRLPNQSLAADLSEWLREWLGG